MNSAKFAAIILVIGCFATACTSSDTVATNQAQPAASPATATGAAPAAAPDPLAAAYADYQKNCQLCHGEKGQGGTVTIEGRRLKVPSLRDGHALEHTDEKFVKQISEGDDEMPAFKEKLSPDQINQLVKFIRKEFQGK